MRELTAETLSAALSGRLAAGEVTVEDCHVHAGGASRDTVALTADDGERTERLVLRRERADDGPVTALVNDLRTEYDVLAALAEGPARVPAVHFYEGDASVLGAPFFAMEALPGEAPSVWRAGDRAALHEAWDDPDRSLPGAFVDALAEVHAVDPATVPSLDPAPDDVVGSELDRLESAYRAVEPRTEPAVEEAFRWLRANRPEVPETTLIHGDWWVGNVVVDGDDVAGIVDWELARAGDPMFDLGFASTRYFAGKVVEEPERPELACALLERGWFYDRYERRTGRTVDRERVRYWRVVAILFALTVGLAGVARYAAGGDDDPRHGWFQYTLPGRVEDLLDAVRADRT